LNGFTLIYGYRKTLKNFQGELWPIIYGVCAAFENRKLSKIENEYHPINSLDDNYDGSLYQMGSFDGEEVDLEVAKQETLVEIKKSESFWAFLSCAVLIIGKSASALIGRNINGIFRFVIGCL